jgi:hypothetical protein
MRPPRPWVEEDLSMITFVRTMLFAPGKNAEVMSFTRLLRKLLSEKYGLELRALAQVGGDPTRIAYVATFANLAEYEQMLLKLLSDAEYLKLTAAYFPHIVVGSIKDQLWRDI